MSGSSDVRYPIGRFDFNDPYRVEDRAMYKIIAIVCGLLLFSTAASAQRFNAFVGYSYSGFGPTLGTLQLDPLSPKIHHSLNGWNASLEAKVLPVLGIVADFSGHYGNATTDVVCSQYTAPFCYADNENVSLYTLTAGPQISLRLGRFEPFAHALFGADVRKTSTSALVPYSDISFADMLGGGISVSVISRLAWRVQADDLQTRFLPRSYSSLQNQKNRLRLSTGLLFRF
jgi:hypothetical protein